MAHTTDRPRRPYNLPSLRGRDTRTIPAANPRVSSAPIRRDPRAWVIMRFLLTSLPQDHAMQSLGIILVVVGALGLTIAAISKLLVQWPAAGKAGGLSLGLVVVGVILWADRKSTRLNSSHLGISYAVFCLKT